MRKLLSVVALATVTAVSAHAQDAAASVKPITFGVKAGASIPTGTFADGSKTGFDVGGHIGLAAAGLPVTFRGEVDYNQFSSKSSGVDNGRIWAFTGNVLYNLPVASTIRPYAIAGLGLYNVGTSSASENKFGFNAGAGLSIPLSGFNTFVEARYTRISTNGGSIQYVPINFGISF